MSIISKYVLDEQLRKSAQRMKQVQDKAKEQKRKATIGDTDSATPNPVDVNQSQLFFPEGKR